MPTYQYACTECGEPLEVVQRFSDDPLTQCPSCEGRLRKVFSAVGVVFKGSGFYRTDSRSPAGAGAKSKAADGAASKDSGSSDSSSSSPNGDGAGSASKSKDTAGKTTSADSSSKTSAA